MGAWPNEIQGMLQSGSCPALYGYGSCHWWNMGRGGNFIGTPYTEVNIWRTMNSPLWYKDMSHIYLSWHRKNHGMKSEEQLNDMRHEPASSMPRRFGSWPLFESAGKNSSSSEVLCCHTKASNEEGKQSLSTFWTRNYFFLILAHPVYKIWIIQEPNTIELWNKLHFEEKKTESIYHV